MAEKNTFKPIEWIFKRNQLNNFQTRTNNWKYTENERNWWEKTKKIESAHENGMIRF